MRNLNIVQVFQMIGLSVAVIFGMTPNEAGSAILWIQRNVRKLNWNCHESWEFWLPVKICLVVVIISPLLITYGLMNPLIQLFGRKFSHPAS